MSLNIKCPRCGSTHVQLSNERSKHGLLWFILLGWYYLIILLFKWIIGFMFLVYVDWWVAIIRACRGRGYVWHCTKWFSLTKKIYYCHNCGYNFRA